MRSTSDGSRMLVAVLTPVVIALFLAACGGLASPEPVAAPGLEMTAIAPQNTIPADMPTAAPIWTPTNTPAPAATGAPAGSQPGLDVSVAAMVNGTAISRADYDGQLAQAQTNLLQQPGLDPKSPDGQEMLKRLQEQVLGWMIDQVLIEQAAAAQGIQIPPERVDAEIAQMRGGDAARFERWLAANGLTLETLQRQVRMDLMTAAMRDSVTASTPRQVPQVHIRHILLSDEAVARLVLDKLRQGDDFAALARQYSQDQATAGNGGDLGFLPKGVMPPAFEQAALALKPGSTSDIISSDLGFHLVQVLEVDRARTVPDQLWPVVQQVAFEEWLAAQRAKAQIQRNVP